ncbi:hypothetical protein VL06_01320 [Rossellomorea marisflavi]|nr:hypothetical protein VL06_01320 [Rossellomorea marisflavi]KML34589.1 hypothetical protein VL12_04175 [Rossellomorea marisflavi]
MTYLNRGKERIKFDCEGDRMDLHILQCMQCSSEFRSTMEEAFTCNTCQDEKSPVSGFKVIGMIEKKVGNGVHV